MQGEQPPFDNPSGTRTQTTRTTTSDLDRRPTFVVGIGASAGGLEALERFFEKVPPETGLAFVVIQHLSPDFKSLTDELLARRTPIPIHRVENGMAVQRDAIYLIPPRKDMIVADGRLLLTDKDPAQVVALPIDHFFRSLAQDAGERAIAVILSGTGSDGSRGIRDVHEAGGLVVVQLPETAKFDGMPNSAVKTGIVDVVLAPEEMPAALLKYIKHPLYQDAARLPGAAVQAEVVPEGAFDAICRLLRNAYGLDFSYYKPGTVNRRIERRLVINGSISLEEYVGCLERDPEELNCLYKDLLIGVTRFFRDREAFEHLERDVLPPLLSRLGRDDDLRIWVAGCATGEEAYSLAILVHEGLEKLNRTLPVKIFASDVHRGSLEMASAGVYSAAALADVGPERLQRHFLPKGDDFQVVPELRKLVVFAQHNVIKDAPFTKLDLISCRNLLIYLRGTAQKKALSLFHFGLKTGGVLFLGPSESPGELSDEFEAIGDFGARCRLYRKRRDIRLPTDIRLMPGLGGAHVGPPPVGSGQAPPAYDSQLLGTYDALLDAHMPPSLLVNEHRAIVQSFAGGSRYLRHRDGRFSADVLDMVDAELRMALTGALQRAFKETRPIVYKGLRVRLPEGERLVTLTVKPVPNRRAGTVHALVCLEDQAPPAPPPAAQEIDLGRASQEHMLSLESELRYTRENLQATIEELETSNEELQATNEELLASNEELQSTNEELHSVNEELYTVNAEYQKKIAELTELTADMDNLLASTQVHTVFLDRELRIRKFTPQIGATFNLLPQDVGRRIDSFTHNIDHPALLGDIEEVLHSGRPREKQVRDRRGNWFLLRILPYHNGPVVEGVVLTLVDIGSLKRAEARAQAKDEQLSAILRNSPNLVSIMDLEGRYILTDGSFRQAAGRDPLGLTPHELFPPGPAEALLAHKDRAIAEGKCIESEIVLQTAAGGPPHTYLSLMFPLRDEAGRVTTVGGIMTDVTRLKEAERKALGAVTQRDRFLAMLSHELRNPLAAILNAAGAMERGRELPGEDGERLQVVKRRARHMARLLDDLLDVARLTQNKIEVRKQVLDLGSTIDEAIEEVRARFEERGLRLEISRPGEPLPVEGEPARLQQIHVNLLMNAAKYTPGKERPGGGEGRVWFSMRREGDQAVIRVRDNGIGIPAAALETIFDLFVQGERAPEAGGGIGVGLTLVRAIVEVHGGRVKAFSDGPGKGSEFVVWLPLARAAAGGEVAGWRGGEDKHHTTTPPHHPDGAGAARGLRILLVEDDPDIRSTMQEVLEFDGCEVRSAGNGPQALQAVEEGAFDVALVDIGLPGMDGYELARRLRQRPGVARLPLVALTGYGRSSDRQATRAAGFDAHVTKPVDPDELYRVLQALARQRGDRSVPADKPGR
jgi:two-component system CheB/CheR fusion protein